MRAEVEKLHTFTFVCCIFYILNFLFSLLILYIIFLNVTSWISHSSLTNFSTKFLTFLVFMSLSMTPSHSKYSTSLILANERVRIELEVVNLVFK
jgi:hypothetical protein